jgi:hypothetical protein
LKTMSGINDLRRFIVRYLTRFEIAFVALLAVSMAPDPAFSQGAGDILVAPTRIVFEGRDRSAQLSLANKGSATATYRISVVNMAMDETGNLKEINKPVPGQKFSDKLFRYSPRQVTLKPGQSQAVRFLLRKPGGLENGEYRSHVMLRAIPKEGGESIERTEKTEGVQIRLIPIYGITIPIIVRQGDLKATAALSDLTLVATDKDNPLPRLRFRISREGNRSTFGDLTATFSPKGGGGDVVVGQIMRLAVYTPNTARTVEMVLRTPEGVDLANGSLSVAYRATEEEGGALYGEQKLDLP